MFKPNGFNIPTKSFDLEPLILIDGYKIDHRSQYPKGTRRVYSNLTPRGTRVIGAQGVVFFGLQYFLDYYLTYVWNTGFFRKAKADVVAAYQGRLNKYLGPNGISLYHIEALHDLGYLPLKFKAVPEGTFVPLRVPVLTIENTHPDFAWLTNYMETLMSNILWKPCTSATTAKHLRSILDKWAEATGASKIFVDWQGHDFSFRGMSGVEDAMLSGAGHLLSFTGTDTLPALSFLDRFYCGEDSPLLGGSVAATEHSVMCAGGKANEEGTFSRILDVYPTGVVSIVSDTWSLWRVLLEIVPRLRDKILSRDGKLVIRPDSGDPVKIICGDPDGASEAERAGVIELLWRTFGGTTNSKGFRTLDPHIGAIYGDSINRERMEAILSGLAAKGFASDNMVFGIGSFTYEYVTRDTFGFAMKATSAEIDGEEVALWKSPVTDSGEKFSARGRLSVMRGDFNQLVLVENATAKQEEESELGLVWEDGVFYRYDSIEEIRVRVRGV